MEHVECLDRAVDVVKDRPWARVTPCRVDLRRLDVEVAQSVRSEVQFVDDRRRAQGEVIAVTDVDSGPRERLARGGAADSGPGLEHNGAQTCLGEIGRRHQAVVACSDHDGVHVTLRHRLILVAALA